MILLKADGRLETIYRRLIQAMGGKVEWEGIFLVSGSHLVLPGRIRSLFFNFSSRKVYTNIGEYTLNPDGVETVEGNDVLVNVLNMTLYAFGKWGAINGLKVEKDYRQLNHLFQNILKEVWVESDFREEYFRFYHKNIQITYEDVIQRAVEWGKAEAVDESAASGEAEDEQYGMGLWHNLVWKREGAEFVKRTRTREDDSRSRLGHNFYMVDYCCPACGNKLHMIVYPVGKEFPIETEEGKVFLARAYTCSICNTFFTPRPEKLIADNDVYAYHFDEDRKAYEDYLELLGKDGDKCTNYKFNEYEADRLRKPREEETLQKACERLEELSGEELGQLMGKIEDGFYGSGEALRYGGRIAARMRELGIPAAGRRSAGKTTGEDYLRGKLSAGELEEAAGTGTAAPADVSGRKGGSDDGRKWRKPGSAKESENLRNHKEAIDSGEPLTGAGPLPAAHEQQDQGGRTSGFRGAAIGSGGLGGSGGLDGSGKLRGSGGWSGRYGSGRAGGGYGTGVEASGRAGSGYGTGVEASGKAGGGYGNGEEAPGREQGLSGNTGRVNKGAENKETINKEALHTGIDDTAGNRADSHINVREASSGAGDSIESGKADGPAAAGTGSVSQPAEGSAGKEESGVKPAEDAISEGYGEEDLFRQRAKEFRGKTYVQMSRIIEELRQLGEVGQEQTSILLQMEERRRKQAQNEAALLISKLPEKLGRKEYEMFREKLDVYKEADITPWEQQLEECFDRAETREIADYVKRAPKRDRKELLRLYEELRQKGYREKNASPYLEKIHNKILQIDQAAIDEICPNVLNLDFNEAMEIYEKIKAGVFLPELKTSTLDMLDKRLTRMKTEENVQLIRKLERELDEKMEDTKRLYFYDARRMMQDQEEEERAGVMNRAVSAYGSGRSKYEYPLLIGDSSKKEDGREGFILTPDHIFYRTRFDSGCIGVTDVKDVTYVKGRIGDLGSAIVVRSPLGKKKLPPVVKKEERRKLAEALGEFISYLQDKPESRKIDYLAKEKHEVKCCLRCGYSFRDGNICPKCGSKANR